MEMFGLMKMPPCFGSHIISQSCHLVNVGTQKARLQIVQTGFSRKFHCALGMTSGPMGQS